MPILFPVFEAPDILEPVSMKTIDYPPAPAFNFITGEYVKDGAGRIKMLDGQKAWEQSCLKRLITRRFAFLIYSTDYGSEGEDLIKGSLNHVSAESEIMRDFTEALLVDPRTQSVKNFTFSWNGDTASVSLTAYPAIGEPARLEVTVNG